MKDSVSGGDLFQQLFHRAQKSSLFFQEKELKAIVFFEEAIALGKSWQDQGVGARDLIASCGNKEWMFRSFLAALSIDAVFCPVAFHWQEKDLLPVASLRKIWWYCQGEEFKSFEGTYEPWQFLEEMKAPCLLLRTSASLSEGRWVGYETSHLWQQLVLHDENLPASSRARLQILPLYHTFGLVLDLMLGLYRGQNFHFIEMEAVSQGLWLKKTLQNVWDMALTPRLAYLAARLMKSKSSRGGLLHVGGAPLMEICRFICEETFETVVEGYGLTECGPGVLLEGKPLKGIEMRVEPLHHEKGVLWIKSPMMGLWQKRSRQLVSGWFCTQDLVTCQEGKWKIIGRSSRFLKQSDGRWCNLDEFEHLLCSKLQLAALKIEPSLLGGYRVFMLENEQGKSEQIESFLQERTGLGVVIEPVSDDRLLQKTSKTVL